MVNCMRIFLDYQQSIVLDERIFVIVAVTTTHFLDRIYNRQNYRLPQAVFDYKIMIISTLKTTVSTTVSIYDLTIFIDNIPLTLY